MQGQPGNERSPVERPGWRETARDPAVVAILVYAGIAVAAAVAAYLAIFTTFAGYDDEGTLLVSLQAFMNGGTLYQDVYSPYGPFYYEVFGGLLSLFGASVSTDLSRSMVIVVWIVTSFLFGYSVQRLSGRLALGAAGMIVAFASLTILINEPMHPHGLAIMMAGVFTLLAVIGPSRGRTWLGALAGAALAALILTKVNLGGFAIAGTVLAAVFVVEPFSRIRWLRWLVALGFIALPLLIAVRDLDVSQTRELVWVQTLAAIALVVAGWRLRGDGGEADRPTLRWLLAGVGGFIAAFIAILVAIFLVGSSPGDVYQGVVTEALRVRDVKTTLLIFPTSVVDWAVIALAVAVIAVLFGRREGPASVWPGLLRAAAGLITWYAVAHVVVVGFNPSAENPLILPALLAWIVALPPVGVEEGTPRRLLRILLPGVAIAEVLSVYPIAGTQVGIAATLFVPVGGLLLADAIVDLRAWAAGRDGITVARLGIVTTVLSLALVLQLGVDSIARPAISNLKLYRDQPALDLPGAGLLHIAPPQPEIYERLVELIHEYDCTTFIGYPNVNSLYLWSEIEPPPPAAPGAWVGAANAEYQQQAVDALKASERPCAIINEPMAAGWVDGGQVPDRPLKQYVLSEFKPVETVEGFEFSIPK